ncbi:MAG: hypothetical protein QGF68_17890 [Nitrospinota bacterium]|nr:hypothetical protein [Nitrospinota bacterium]
MDESDIGRRLSTFLVTRYEKHSPDRTFLQPIEEEIHRYFQVWEREADVPSPQVYRYNQF